MNVNGSCERFVSVVRRIVFVRIHETRGPFLRLQKLESDGMLCVTHTFGWFISLIMKNCTAGV